MNITEFWIQYQKYIVIGICILILIIYNLIKKKNTAPKEETEETEEEDDDFDVEQAIKGMTERQLLRLLVLKEYLTNWDSADLSYSELVEIARRDNGTEKN